MTIGIHVARVGLFTVDAIGNVILKTRDDTPTRQFLSSGSEHRIIPDATIPNSNNYPNVEVYLHAEADDDYVLQHMDQTTIVTYLRNATGGFPTP
jgi:hypothetical protein